MKTHDPYEALASAIVGPSIPTDFVYAPIVDEERIEPPYGDLDAGIRELVRWLYDEGFNPSDSGDGSKAGQMECAVDYPHAFMIVHPVSHLIAEVERLQLLVDDRGDLEGWQIEGNYSPGGPALIFLYQPSPN